MDIAPMVLNDVSLNSHHEFEQFVQRFKQVKQQKKVKPEIDKQRRIKFTRSDKKLMLWLYFGEFEPPHNWN